MIFSHIPKDVQQNIVEYFGDDEWNILIQSKLFKSIDFKKVNNYKVVNIFVNLDGSLSRELNPYDIFKRFIVTPITMNYLLQYADIVYDIMINMPHTPFEIVPDAVIFNTLRPFTDEEIEKLLDRFNSDNYEDEEYDNLDDLLDVEPIAIEYDPLNLNQVYDVPNGAKFTVIAGDVMIPKLPNLRKLYICSNNLYSFSFDNVDKTQITIYWLKSRLYTIG